MKIETNIIEHAKKIDELYERIADMARRERKSIDDISTEQLLYIAQDTADCLTAWGDDMSEYERGQVRRLKNFITHWANTLETH